MKSIFLPGNALEKFLERLKIGGLSRVTKLATNEPQSETGYYGGDYLANRRHHCPIYITHFAPEEAFPVVVVGAGGGAGGLVNAA
jgi:hypothetical protein